MGDTESDEILFPPLTPLRKRDSVPQKQFPISHIAPGNPAHGYQIVCYALNDLKGHLPYNCFKALMETSEWKSLMGKWKAQAKKNPDDREAFKNIVREKQTPEIPHL